MTLTLLDWLIVVVSMGFLIGVVRMSKRYMRSVADFLSAGRTAGRYMISMSQGMSALGSITIIGMWEMNYVAGFSLRWWEFTMGVVLLGFIALAARTLRAGAAADEDPWEGHTLEWSTSSPAPVDNFAETPTVMSPEPLLDMRAAPDEESVR